MDLLILGIRACAFGCTLKKWVLRMIVQSHNCIHHSRSQTWHLHHGSERAELSISCSYICATYACAMNNSDALSCQPLSLRATHQREEKLISGSKSALHCFSALPNHQLCLADARRWKRCSTNELFFFSSGKEFILTYTHTKTLIKTPAWYMKNIRVCEVGLFPAQGWFILD